MLIPPFWKALLLLMSLGPLLYTLLRRTFDLARLIGSWIGARRSVRSLIDCDRSRFPDPGSTPPISLLVPAANASATIVDSVGRLLSLDFPLYEVIVINDGSTDDTLPLLIEAYGLIPFEQPYKRSLATARVRRIYRSAQHAGLVVVDKEAGGRADALNAGINLSSYPLFLSVDPALVLDKSALTRIACTFVSDPACVAVGGLVRIGDGRRPDARRAQSPVAMLQTIEVLRAFFAGWTGYRAPDPRLIIPGMLGAFLKRTAIDAGGYRRGSLDEEADLTLRIHRLLRASGRSCRVRCLPEPICRMRPLATFADLKGQWRRQQAGLTETLLRHRDMLLRPARGRAGLLRILYCWTVGVAGPVIETLGFVFVPLALLLGVVDWHFFITYFLAAALYGTILSAGALLLEETAFRKTPDVGRLTRGLLFALADGFGIEQVRTVHRVAALMGGRGNAYSQGGGKGK